MEVLHSLKVLEFHSFVHTKEHMRTAAVAAAAGVVGILIEGYMSWQVVRMGSRQRGQLELEE